MTQLLRFITRTQLVRFRLKPSLTTPIPPPQTVTLLQFSTKSSATCLRDRSPENEAQPSGFTLPTVRPANPPAPKASVGSVRHPVTLTEELSRNVILLSCESTAEGGVCHIYLVGTCHDSKESRIQVAAIIEMLKPEAVFLELCSSRVNVLNEEEEKVDEISGKFEVFPSSEFAVAYEEAIKYGGKVILGDRPNEITYKRLWSNMPLWNKTLWFALYIPVLVFPRSSHDCMDEESFLISMSLFANGKDVLVHERDKFMSSTLLKVARESRSVVAVVGMNHLQGIKRNWKQPVVLEDLLTLTVPSPKPEISATRILTFVGVAIAGVSIISELYL